MHKTLHPLYGVKPNSVVNLTLSYKYSLGISSPCPDRWLGQMASIPLPIDDADVFKKKLLDTYRIQVPVFQWEKNIYLRYSIQAYNSNLDLEKLLSAVKELLS